MASKAKEQPETPNFLSEVQHRAALAIASGRSGRSVALELGVHESTLSKWKATPEFRATVNQMLAEVEAQTATMLVQASRQAISTLASVMTSDTATDSDKIRAALAILDRTNPSPAAPGPTDPDKVREQDEARRKSDELMASLSVWTG